MQCDEAKDKETERNNQFEENKEIEENEIEIPRELDQ